MKVREKNNGNRNNNDNSSITNNRQINKIKGYLT